MRKRDIRCFEHARHAAEMSSFGRVRIGCVVTQNGKVLSAGFNSRKTNPHQKSYNRFRSLDLERGAIPAALHAEIAALLPLRHSDVDWDKVEVFIYRIRKDRPHGLAAPCPACRQYMKDLGIKKIHYTGDDGYIYEEIA